MWSILRGLERDHFLKVGDGFLKPAEKEQGIASLGEQPDRIRGGGKGSGQALDICLQAGGFGRVGRQFGGRRLRGERLTTT